MLITPGPALVTACPGASSHAATAAVPTSNPPGAIVVHFDVDAVDSADLPLANSPPRQRGLRFDAALAVRHELCVSQRSSAWC